MTLTDEETLRKKLAYRSWHRGTREMDLILGRFAESYLPSAGGAALRGYADLLEQNDPDLYDWITEQSEPPQDVADVIIAIRDSCSRAL